MDLFQIVGFLLAAGILAGLLAMGYLVYRDARRSGIPYPLLWGFLSVVGGVTGVILYVLVKVFDPFDFRDDETATVE